MAASASRRVFLSYTAELRDIPKETSFAAAARAAVRRAGDTAVAMTDLSAQDRRPAEVSRAEVTESDVYVLIAGFRYGSLVQDRPETSYPELEFRAATERGLPRLVFLLGEDTLGPVKLFLDPHEKGSRQANFREQLVDSGVVTATVTSPKELEEALFRALSDLPTARSNVARVWNIPARRPVFVGRERDLDRLATTLTSPGSVAAVYALHGIGGIGKTALALEYVHRHARDYDIAWWVHAEAPETIPASLAQLAYALDLAREDDGIDFALSRLFDGLGERKRWLLVFDNAEEPRELEHLLPARGGGHVLITSRSARWRTTAESIGLDVFERSESVALLQTGKSALPPHDADRIAAELGDLPLAVAQATALLDDTRMSANAYLRMLRDQPGDLLSLASRPLSRSLSVAFEQVQGENLAAWQLLNVLAWMAPEAVPQVVIFGASMVLPDPLRDAATSVLKTADTVRLLRRRGLVQVEDDGLLLHRIPAALLRERARGDGMSGDQWPAIVVRLLYVNLTERSSEESVAWPTWQRLLPHVLWIVDQPDDRWSVPRDKAWLLSNAGRYLLARGEPRQAEAVLERAYVFHCETLGSDDPETLSTAGSLGLVRRSRGDYLAARELDTETLVRARAVLGDQHLITLRAAHNLAMDLRITGEYLQARELDQETLGTRRNVLGSDHPDTLNSASALATDLRNLEEFAPARDLDDDTLARSRRVLGVDHPATIEVARRLAATLRAMGDRRSARKLIEEAVTRLRRVLGDDHPNTLAAAVELATDLRSFHEHDVARSLAQDTMDRGRRVLGPDDPTVLSAAAGLADDLYTLGAEDEARALDQDTLARLEQYQRHNIELRRLAEAIAARLSVRHASHESRLPEDAALRAGFRAGSGDGRPFGREDVLNWLVDRRLGGTSVALLGPRRAGKSWILGELHRRLPRTDQVVKLTLPTPSHEVENADALAVILDPVRSGSRSPAADLLRRASARRSDGRPMVYLLDEVGRLNHYHPAAISWLRDLGQAGAWIVFTGTQKDWHTVVRRALTAPGSSFGNDVNSWELGPWTERAALRFVTSTAAYLGVDLDRRHIGRAIVERVGTWPFYLQVVGDAVVRAVRDGNLGPLQDNDRLDELIQRRLIDEWTIHFEGRWHEIGLIGRSALLDHDHERADLLTAAQRQELRNVGLLRPGDEWLHDPPFYSWIARNASALRDLELPDS